MTVKQLQSHISKTLGLKARNPRSMERLLDDCARFARYGELSDDVYQAVMGIAWALSTGRLDGILHIAIRDMSGSLAVALIAAVATNCQTQGEVPRWLIANADVIISAQPA